MCRRIGDIRRIGWRCLLSCFFPVAMAILWSNAAVGGIESGSPLQGAKADEEGLVRYHGRFVSLEEKNAIVELEIRHVQGLLDEASALYKAVSPEGVALLFNQAQQFMGKFEADEAVDEHIEEKLLLVLGFLYAPVERSNEELKQDLAKQMETDDWVAVLEAQKRLEVFSREVYIPLMKSLAERMVAYVSHKGKAAFVRLMTDNNLGELFRDDELIRSLE